MGWLSVLPRWLAFPFWDIDDLLSHDLGKRNQVPPPLGLILLDEQDVI